MIWRALIGKARGWFLGVGAVLALLVAAYFRGRADADLRHEFEDAEAYRDTRKRIDQVDIDDAGAARRWLSDRMHDRAK